MAKGNKEFRLEVPGGENVVLLHTCCAPCSSAIIECMMQNGITPVIYYCNPNIYPREEYEIRKNECTRYAQALGLEIVDADYDHENWLGEVAGMENEPERGGRCLKCFKLRLLRTAEFAVQRGIKVIIAAAGMAAALPGVIAASTTLPVIGVPIKGSVLDGMDALYSILQMPPGIPVATVAINGAMNAAILAMQILALSDADIAVRFADYKASLCKKIEKANKELAEVKYEYKV